MGLVKVRATRSRIEISCRFLEKSVCIAEGFMVGQVVGNDT